MILNLFHASVNYPATLHQGNSIYFL
jgi:hypothetical protein